MNTRKHICTHLHVKWWMKMKCIIEIRGRQWRPFSLLLSCRFPSHSCWWCLGKRGQYSSLDLHAMIDVVPMKYENDDDDVDDDDDDVQYQKWMQWMSATNCTSLFVRHASNSYCRSCCPSCFNVWCDRCSLYSILDNDDNIVRTVDATIGKLASR